MAPDDTEVETTPHGPSRDPFAPGKLLLAYVIWGLGIFAIYGDVFDLTRVHEAGNYLGQLLFVTLYFVLIQSPLAGLYYQRTRANPVHRRPSTPGSTLVFKMFAVVVIAFIVSNYIRPGSNSPLIARWLLDVAIPSLGWAALFVYFPLLVAASIFGENVLGSLRASEPNLPPRGDGTTAPGDIAPEDGAGGVDRDDHTSGSDRRLIRPFWGITGVIVIIISASMAVGRANLGIGLSGLLLTLFQMWDDRS